MAVDSLDGPGAATSRRRYVSREEIRLVVGLCGSGSAIRAERDYRQSRPNPPETACESTDVGRGTEPIRACRRAGLVAVVWSASGREDGYRLPKVCQAAG